MPDSRSLRPILPPLYTAILVLVAAILAIGAAAAPADGAPPAGDAPPWEQAGLSEREAAAHLLDRFTFGPRPGDVDRVLATGPEAWFEEQLAADLPETGLDRRRAPLDVLRMDPAEVMAAFPGPGVFLRQAMEAGVLPEEAAGDPRAAMAEMDPAERRALQREIAELARRNGFRPNAEMDLQVRGHKLLAAVYAENQLHEMMVDFWFNHFNVYGGKPEVRPFVVSYERDALRPHALGSFRELLGATAHHPAMLAYLDNVRSTAEPGAPTLAEQRMERSTRGRRGFGMGGRGGRAGGVSRGGVSRGGVPRGGVPRGGVSRGEDVRPPRRGSTGLNENYARELLELHTLGVDGGYDQEDVVEVARAFTGWSIVPPGPSREDVERRLRQAGRHLERLGFVRDGEFLFRADAHDAGPKTVLGHELPAGRGMEDGEDVLDLLAAHPSTARHLAHKLAVRFVADEPPPALVDRLAAAFTDSGGDVRAVLRALFHSPDFWAPEVRAAKVRSPLELTAAALRGLGADVADPRDVLGWIQAMGQPLYAYEAPTGFPDRAQTWVGTGTLLARMNFGLALAAGGVDGVELAALEEGWAGLTGAGEPESLSAALETVFRRLMPERDPAPTVEALLPLARAEDLPRRLAAASASLDGGEGAEARVAPDSYTLLQQVVGLVLGSPEYQRR